MGKWPHCGSAKGNILYSLHLTVAASPLPVVPITRATGSLDGRRSVWGCLTPHRLPHLKSFTRMSRLHLHESSCSLTSYPGHICKTKVMPVFPTFLLHLTARENHVRSASSWSEATLCFADNTFRQRLPSVQENFRKDFPSD